MAIDKRQNFFRNEIGVNRGSGFSSAANQKMDDARAFDQIVETVAKREQKNLIQKGKKDALEASRTIPYVYETLEDGTKVPVIPEVPDYLTGKTSAATFEELIFDRYHRDIKAQIKSIIQDSAQNAKFNRSRPDVYETEAQGRIKPLLDTVQGTLGSSIKDYAFNTINDYEYNVATEYDRNLRSENRIQHDRTAIDIHDERISYIYNTTQDNPQLREKFKKSMEGTGRTEDYYKSKMEEYDSEGTAHRYVSKNLFKYFNKSSKNPISLNRAGADVDGIINFINTPSEQTITLSDGKTLTREEINKNITTDKAKKSVLEVLKNYKKIYKQTTRNVRQNEIITSMIDRSLEKDNGESNFFNPKYTPDATKTYSSVSKAYNDNQDLVIQRYNNEVARVYNLPEVKDGILTEEYKKWTLKTFGILPSNEHSVFSSSIKSRQITNEIINSYATAYDYLEETNFTANMLNLNTSDKETLVAFGVLYKNNNFNKEKTIQDFNQIMQDRNVSNVNNILFSLKKQGPEGGDTFLGLMVDQVLNKGDFQSLPYAKTKRLAIASIKNMMVMSYQGDYGKSEPKFKKEFVIPAIGMILSNTPNDGGLDETPIGQTFSTVNMGIRVMGKGEKSYVEDPAEIHYGIDYDSLDFVDPLEDTSFRLKYLSDHLKSNPYKGMYINTADGEIKVGADARILPHYFDGNIKLMPEVDYFSEKPSYKLVYVNEVEDNSGNIRQRYIDVLDGKTDKPILLTEEMIEDLKDNYIKKITSGR